MVGERAGRAVAFLAGLACCAALAGCESNPEPAPLPSQSPAASTPTETESPTPTPPTMPAEARGTSEKSAKAFVRYYVAAVNFAMRTGNTKALLRLADDSCVTCTAITDRIEDVYSSGGRLEGDGWVVSTVSVIPLARERVLASVGIRISSQAAYSSPESRPSRSSASRGNLDFHLEARGSEWRVVRLDATQ